MKTPPSQLDREIAQALAHPATNEEPSNIYAAPVLGGAYKGGRADLSRMLKHAVSDVPIHVGRLKREPGEAFCDKKLNDADGNLADSGTWTNSKDVTCPKCLEILARIGVLRVGSTPQPTKSPTPQPTKSPTPQPTKSH